MKSARRLQGEGDLRLGGVFMTSSDRPDPHCSQRQSSEPLPFMLGIIWERPRVRNDGRASTSLLMMPRCCFPSNG